MYLQMWNEPTALSQGVYQMAQMEIYFTVSPNSASWKRVD